MGHMSIDFRHRDLRFLETDGSIKSLKLKAFRVLNPHREDTDIFEGESSIKAVSDALNKTLSSGKFTKDPTGMAVASSYCIFRDIELPFKNPDQIRKVIKFEVENQIQTDIDDLVISFFKKTETLDKSMLLVAGAKKDLLNKQLELLQTRDLDPFSIDIDILCTYNALAATGYLQEHERFLVVNVSDDATDVMTLNRGQLISARSIPLGIHSMCVAVEHDLKIARIPYEESIRTLMGVSDLEDLTIHAGEVEESELLESDEETKSAQPQVQAAGPAQPEEQARLIEKRRNAFLTRLRRELMRTMAFMTQEDQPEKIYVTGAGCALEGLQELFKELFSVDVEELDLLSRVSHNYPEEQVTAINREITVPLGVAFKAAGHDVSSVDLRQEEVRYAKKFDQIKVPLACLIFLFLIFIVLMNLEKYMLRDAKRKDFNKITMLSERRLEIAKNADKAEVQKILARYPQGLPRVNGIKRAMDKECKRLGDKLGREGSIPQLPSVMPAWHAFFNWIEKNLHKFEFFRLNKLDIKIHQRDPKLVFDCDVRSGADESILLDDLAREVPIFSKVIGRGSKPQDSPMGPIRVCKNWTIELDYSKLGAMK